jgi:hypothetical protein
MRTIKWDGNRITKPGIYHGLSLEQYHDPDVCDGPSISSSDLRRIFAKEDAEYIELSEAEQKRIEVGI